MVSIYGLYDQTGALRYIGKANDPNARVKSHIRDSRRRNTPLYSWLRKHGLPTMRVLHVCSEGQDWREVERTMIAHARDDGEALLNLADGGDQPMCSNAVCRANAIRLNEQLNLNPKAKRLQGIKRQVANGIKNGTMSEASKQKFRDLAMYAPEVFGCWRFI